MSIARIVEALNAQGAPRKLDIDPAVLALPPSVLAADLSMAQRLAAEEAKEDAAAAKAAYESEVAAAEAELASSVYTRTQSYRGDPPPADQLGVDINGASDRKGLLIRFVAWLAATRKQLADLERGREAYLLKLGIPALTRAEIERVVSQDKHGLLAFMRSRGEAMTDPQIRAFEKQRLDAKLEGDTYEATLAREALAEADAEVVTLQAAVKVLEDRHRHFVHLALIDEAEDLGRVYADQITALRDTLCRLLGLGVLVRNTVGLRGNYAPDETDISLPFFALKSVPGYQGATIPAANIGRRDWPKIAVTKEQAVAAADVWKTRERELLEKGAGQ